jgi:hypothetical protein
MPVFYGDIAAPPPPPPLPPMKIVLRKRGIVNFST